LRVTRYEIAEETGGAGRFRGGNGLIRALQLTGGRAQVSLLAERHTVAPRGARGGANGTPGRHRLESADGTESTLPAKTTFDFAPGETLEVQTPGGGGFGVA
jgi:N-methylhydantoinase B